MSANRSVKELLLSVKWRSLRGIDTGIPLNLLNTGIKYPNYRNLAALDQSCCHGKKVL